VAGPGTGNTAFRVAGGGPRDWQASCLAAAQPALARRALRIDKPVVLKHSGFHGRFELPIRLDRWSVLSQLLIDGYAHVLGRNDGIGKRDKYETRADQAHLHRDEYRLISRRIEVDSLRGTDLRTVSIQDRQTYPVCDASHSDHGSTLATEESEEVTWF
jgi:hypothetical protein